jgi:Cu(I)/Ag(I) efflux system membrane fusion protein
MPLSKRKKGEKISLPPGILHRLQLTPVRMRQAGVASEELAFRNLVREIRTVGALEWDERKIAHPSVRIAGRVDELYVNFVGQRIRKGDPLYKLYSPDLVTTQEEFLLALRTLDEIKARGDAGAVGRAQRLADAARERMRLWGISDDQVAALEKSRKADTHAVIASPIGGVVIKKDIDIGRYVMVGEDPWTVADDTAFWMQAQVFERDLGLVKEGQQVEISAEAFPGRKFGGKVAFIAPEVQADTRTARVRVEIPNPDGALRSGMYVTAVFRVPLGRSGEVFYGC